MSKPPLVSYIVRLYNYGQYVGRAIQSILDQTVRELEVVVVDDASEDDSVAVVSGLDDPRIRLFTSERNCGIVEAHNRALGEARGEWLAILDADDWIAARKTEAQLAAADSDPTLDIIGTYVVVVDAQGGPHPLTAPYEAAINAPHDFGDFRTWISMNYLCNSSTMVRRSTHHRLGTMMPGMIRAQDYEFWTRALRAGCRFGMVPEQLTTMRIHGNNLGTGDPAGTMLEMSYAMLRNLLPIADEHEDHSSFKQTVSWLAAHPAFEELPHATARRLLGLFITGRASDSYFDFRDTIATSEAQHQLELAGRHCEALLQPDPATAWFEQQAQNWRAAFENLAAAYGVQLNPHEEAHDDSRTSE